MTGSRAAISTAIGTPPIVQGTALISTRITFALILAAAVVPPGAANAPVTTPSEILANPDRFDGQVVTIEGTVTNLRQRVSRVGDPYYKFDLSDGKQAVRVVSLGRSPCRSGAVMVEGTFNKMKRGRRYTSYNVVNASRVICRQGSPGDEPGGRARSAEMPEQIPVASRSRSARQS